MARLAAPLCSDDLGLQARNVPLEAGSHASMVALRLVGAGLVCTKGVCGLPLRVLAAPVDVCVHGVTVFLGNPVLRNADALLGQRDLLVKSGLGNEVDIEFLLLLRQLRPDSGVGHVLDPWVDFVCLRFSDAGLHAERRGALVEADQDVGGILWGNFILHLLFLL